MTNETTGARETRAPAPRLRDAMILSVFSSIGPFAANTYIPGFHQIAETFAVSDVAVQQSLSLYLVAFALSSLVVGAISDAIGRRPTLLSGTLLFALASIGAMFAGSLEALYFWRVVQGLCAAVGPVVTMASVRDRWSGADAARLLALMALFFAIAPAVAPTAGGFITVAWGWRGVFAFLAALNLSTFTFGCFFLKESHPREQRRALAFGPIFSAYGEAFRHPALLAGVLGHGLCFLGCIVYTAGAADFVVNIMGMGPEDFGCFMLPLVGATMLGAWIGPRVFAHMTARPFILGLGGFMALVGLMGALIEHDAPLPYPFILFMPMLYNAAMSMARPVMNVLNLDYFPRNRGAAASVQQCFQTGAFALSSAVVVPIVLGEVWRYSLVMCFSGIGVVICWEIVFRVRRRLGMSC